MKIAVMCGGPSLERGISLNSARSVMDHLHGDGIEIVPIYFDHHKKAYQVSLGQLYSNTPSDFDFKLQKTAKFLSKTALKELLKSVDLVFPVMHGPFGEDGGIQRILERLKVPYIGSGVEACKRCFDKYEANEFIKSKGFFTLPSTVLKIHQPKEHATLIRDFFKKHGVKRAVVKPATGGSSIGVFSVSTPEEALEKVKFLFKKRMDTRVVVEPFCEGIEFTVIVLQNKFGMPVAVLPTEIEVNYEDNQVFDFRKKYLPSNQVRYHCPPRFSNEVIEKIQVQAEQLFSVLGMQDFARFDGWLLPDGNLWFSDFNPLSGMEQNSFLFQQAARIGMSHRDVLQHVLRRATQRCGLEFPKQVLAKVKPKKTVKVLFGGDTAERQVSLMSGTNVWLKLRRSQLYEPKPYLLDLEGKIWELPYALTLNHTVEEVMENCKKAKENEDRLHFLVEKVRLRLALKDEEWTEPFFIPKSLSLEGFVKDAEFVFSGLHGGAGEDGTLQSFFEKNRVKYNGSGAEASRICMDKFETGQLLVGMESLGVHSSPKRKIALDEKWSERNAELLWKEMKAQWKSSSLIAKPVGDGCSAGVVRLFDGKDLATYLKFAKAGAVFIPKNTFRNQPEIIDMPQTQMAEVLLEPFVETDGIRVKGNRLKWKRKSGWVEVTIGAIERKGKMHAMSPSLTVAEREVLSVEEKFQGGTGINLTPPPEEFVSVKVLERAKSAIEAVCKKIGIEGYCRVDAFMEVDTGDVIVIEINSTPALTPSTVFYHQALAESPSLFPVELLERLIANKGY